MHPMSFDQNLSIVVQNMMSEWGSCPVPELSVLLVQLKFLALCHQTHHWTAKGDSFYGDHLLFERIYGAVVGEIDAVAEKAIGLGSTSNVDMTLQTAQLVRLVQGYGMTQTIPQPSELAKRSLGAEVNFIKTIDILICSMKEAGTMTQGLENMLQGIADVHEGHVYLLKQRCGTRA